MTPRLHTLILDFVLRPNTRVVDQLLESSVWDKENTQTLVAVSTQMSSEEEIMPMWAHRKYLIKLSSTHVGLGMEWAKVGWL